MGSNTYSPSQILHDNLLKQWIPCLVKTAQALVIKKVEEECEDECLSQPSLGKVYLDHLSLQQQSEVRCLCQPNIFPEYPGFTTLKELC